MSAKDSRIMVVLTTLTLLCAAVVLYDANTGTQSTNSPTTLSNPR